jgi:hypothetical protein
MEKIKVLEYVINAMGGMPSSDWLNRPIQENHKASVEFYLLFQDRIFEFVQEPQEADIVPVMLSNNIDSETSEYLFKHFNKNQVAVNIVYVTHIDEEIMKPSNFEYSGNTPFRKIVNLHTDYNKVNDDTSELIYTDFLFNRSHIMHFKRDVIEPYWHKAHKNHWYQKSEPVEGAVDTFPHKTFDITPDHDIIYELQEFMRCVNNHEITPKIFVTPSTTRIKPRVAQRSVLRKELNRLLFDYEGYIGDISQGLSLLPDMDKYHTRDFLGLNGWGFSPPHNAYYNSSSLSIYVETLIYTGLNNTKCITEKTWTPLIKGHFILPFGRAYTLEHLRHDYGFKFPVWIDYSYDVMDPNHKEHFTPFTEQVRWDMFKEEIKRLCDYGATNLYQKKKEDLNMLLHNRSILRDYGCRYDISSRKDLIMG